MKFHERLPQKTMRGDNWPAAITGRLPVSNIYTPRNEVRGGVYWNHPVRPSVRLSVRLSVRPSVDARLGKMVSSA